MYLEKCSSYAQREKINRNSFVRFYPSPEVLQPLITIFNMQLIVVIKDSLLLIPPVGSHFLQIFQMGHLRHSLVSRIHDLRVDSLMFNHQKDEKKIKNTKGIVF